jgi:hypothetical protein
MFESAFKVTVRGNCVHLRIMGREGSGMMSLEKKDAQLLVKLLEGKQTGSVDCYNGGKLEATLEVTVEENGRHVLTAIDRAGREESYPVDPTGGVMFRATCAHDGQLPQFITDLSSAISAIPD